MEREKIEYQNVIFRDVEGSYILTQTISDEGLEQESRKGNGGKGKNFKGIQK